MVAVIDAFRHARLSLAGEVEGGGMRLAWALCVWHVHNSYAMRRRCDNGMGLCNSGSDESQRGEPVSA